MFACLIRRFVFVLLSAVLAVSTALAADPKRNLAVSKTTAAATEQRVALVIGNSSYKSAPLANPVNDARAISAKLRGLGFEVIERQNLTQKQVGGVLREFRSKLKPGGVALFFYAGHGLQVKGVNYLPTVDADIASEEDVPTQSLDANKVLELMDEAKTRMNLVFLDACRNNPYARSFRSAADGLAKVNAPSGTIISFATRPGSVAADAGSGRNGLYTEHLLAAMDLPNQPIEQALKRVVSGVKQSSKGRQEPWMEGSIEGDFYFRWTGQGAQAARPPAAVNPATIELAYWDSIKDSRSAAAFQSYMDKYPNGMFVALARVRLAELSTSAAPAGPQKTGRPDFLEGTWEAQIQNNAFLMFVHWNPANNQYEGMLLKHGLGSAYVGFTLGELIWKAKLTGDPNQLNENQLMRLGQNGNSTGFKWLDGEMNLSRSSDTELVTAFARFRKVSSGMAPPSDALVGVGEEQPVKNKRKK